MKIQIEIKNKKVIEIIEKKQKELTMLHNEKSKYRVEKVPMVKVIEDIILEKNIYDIALAK